MIDNKLMTPERLKLEYSGGYAYDPIGPDAEPTAGKTAVADPPTDDTSQDAPRTVEDLRAELESLDASIAAADALSERHERLKAAGVDLEARTIAGYAARFNVDSSGQCFWSTAFDDWLVKLARKGGTVPLFANHLHDEQLGESVELLVDGAGLYGTFRLAEGARADAVLRRVAALVEAGDPPGLSVGVKSERLAALSGRIIHKAAVGEISLCLGAEPANHTARVGPPVTLTGLEMAREAFPAKVREANDLQERETERLLAELEWKRRQRRWGCR